MSNKCGLGYFRGFGYSKTKESFIATKGNLSCGSWHCEDCRTKKHKKLFARAARGKAMQSVLIDGFRPRYNMKLLTLTFGGKDQRNAFSRDEAYIWMTEAFDKLIRALRKKLGPFEYLRVVEDQRDGYPHFHVLMIGEAIAPKYVLRYIERLWRTKYNLGFVRLNCTKTAQSPKGALGYILKYLRKKPAYYEHKPVYTSSRGMLDPVVKEERVWLSYCIDKGRFADSDQWECLELKESEVTYETLEALKAHVLSSCHL